MPLSYQALRCGEDAVQIPAGYTSPIIRSLGPFRTLGMHQRASGLPRADIGVFGGSGFYAFLPDAVEVAVTTEWGAPSAPVMVGHARRAPGGVPASARPAPRAARASGRLPRQRRHDACARGASAARSVRGGIASAATSVPGDLVVVDQLVDRTQGRTDTFYDHFADGPRHVSLADPYDAELATSSSPRPGWTARPAHDGGTVVVINGPRFSTRAESRWYAAWAGTS